MSNRRHPRLFWYQSTNFGDMLSVYLLAKLFDIPFNDISFVTHDDEREKYIITGSILSVENIKNAIVFGAGFVFSNNYFTGKNIKIAGIRGNMSLKKIEQEKDLHSNENIEILTDVVVGEPSLCLPSFYDPRPEKKYKLGIIPHLFDYQRARSLYIHNPDVLIIDLAQHPGETLQGCIESIIYQINQCESIISSSLHGLIVGMAYGIPVDWCEFNKASLIGDRFKFYDFIESVTSIMYGNGYIQPIDLTNNHYTINQLLDRHRKLKNEKIAPITILLKASQI